MTDLLCAKIWSACLGLDAKHSRVITHPKSGEPVHVGLADYFCQTLFPALLEEIDAPDAAPAEDVAAGEIATVALMALLGPRRASFPPAPIRENLFAHVTAHALPRKKSERLKWIVQLALAYGCGWGRVTPGRDEEWDGSWVSAIQEVVQIAYAFIRKAYATLAMDIRDFNAVGWLEDTRQALKSEAVLITMRFVNRLPMDGDPEYRKYQSIRFWLPNLGNLYGWIKGAVFGSPKGNTAAGYFRNGLLFESFRERGAEPGLDVVDVGNVARQICCHPDEDKEYEGGRCARCQSRCLIVADVYLFVPGIYLPKRFWRCPESDPPHFFDLDLARCPHCGARRGNKATSLFVRAKFTTDHDFLEEPFAEDTTISV